MVEAYQERMADVRLDPGPRDGVYSQATTYAVDTAQRLMNVPVTGRIGPRCINIPMHVAEYFPSLVSIGDAVYVDGGAPAPVLSDSPIAPTTTDPDETTTTTVPRATTTTAAPTTTTVPTETTTTTEPPTTTTPSHKP